MSLFLKILCLAFLVQTGFGAVLPDVPEDCFEGDEDYCLTHIDVKKPLYGTGKAKKMMEVKLFAKLLAEDFDGSDEILERYFDFDNWGEYVGAGVEYSNTYALEKTFRNGKEARQHYAHYDVKGPAGIMFGVKSVTQYWEIDTFDNAEISFEFDNPVKDVSIPIPQLGIIFSKGKGFKYNVGRLHVSKLRVDDEDEEYYVVYYEGWIIPAKNFFWDTAANVTKRSIIATFSGMFLGDD